MSKQKGGRTERELLHMFWEYGWFCIRMAGSGSMPKPCPDLLSGKKGRSLAIECKSGKGTKKYLEAKQIEELKSFAQGFGAEAWVGMRFDNTPWYFLQTHKLIRSAGKNNTFILDKKVLQEKGKTFQQLIGKRK